MILVPLAHLADVRDAEALQPPTLVGLSNYGRLLSDPIFFISLRNSLIYTFVFVPIVRHDVS